MTLPQNPTRTTRDYQALDAAHHIHAFVDQKALNAEGPRVMVRGEGLHLWDNDGKRYLDGMSGLWCTNLGYGRKDLAAAATRQLEQLRAAGRPGRGGRPRQVYRWPRACRGMHMQLGRPRWRALASVP